MTSMDHGYGSTNLIRNKAIGGRQDDVARQKSATKIRDKNYCAGSKFRVKKSQ